MRTLFTLLGLLLLLSAADALALNADADSTADLDHQRMLFLEAERALEAKELVRFRQLKTRLADYPLQPYLEFEEIVATLRQQSPARIRQALTALADTPLRSQLLDQWLGLLAEEGLWHSYLSFYQPGGSTARECQRLHALLETGEQDSAFDAVPQLWLVGKSRPAACDPVFDAWIAAGRLSEELVWKRVALAMQRGEIRLVKYLKRFLSVPERAWVERWLALYKDPARVSRLPTVAQHPMLDEMATQAIQRLAWQDVDAAYTAWIKLNRGRTFSDWQHLQVARSLMGQLSRQESALQSQQITALLPKQYLHLDDGLAEKQLHFALRNGDWQLVLLTLEGLPRQEQRRNNWRYWRARALISLGRSDEGKTILEELATDRSYYGFLAAQRLGDQPKLLHEKLDADPRLIRQLTQHPALRRAYELHRLNRPLPARREWNLAMKRRSDEELRAAARLAERWDWSSQVILTLARLRQWDDLELRFPLSHLHEITSLAKDAGIDKAWIYAILRQESAFMQDAKSPAGARGLMQLMPKTAASMASELQLALKDPDDLYRPELNLRLGTGYLNKIFRRLQENPVLATAAYNAGPWRVRSWLPKQDQPADIWIETVPVRQTREYLKRVLAYTVIYHYRLGQDPGELPARWLQPIEAPAAEEKPLSGV